MQTTDKLMEYIQDSPSPYHAAAAAAARLEAAGFTRLEESAPWALSSGPVLLHHPQPEQPDRLPPARRAPREAGSMTAAHSDSPTFYVKNDALEGDKRYVRLAVEGYGGMNCASWLDRPLTVAGRGGGAHPGQGWRGVWSIWTGICSPSPAWPSTSSGT